MNTDRRPLGTGPSRPDSDFDNPGLSPGSGPAAPRAGLAAERLPAAPAADELVPARPAGRRVLGTGRSQSRPIADARDRYPRSWSPRSAASRPTAVKKSRTTPGSWRRLTCQPPPEAG
ncbi:hypothetical protein OG693_00035 [Streptomyces sp. NBC_01259]|uniref:hypothetical protein n=1 Tax=unclassified Streptomyces TaxID=2593676 RepID=UPI0032522F3B